MMQKAHTYLKDQEGMEFYKLMGSGKTLGKPYADWSTYALIQVWKEKSYADTFFNDSNLIKLYNGHAYAKIRLELDAFKSSGLWDGRKVFIPDISNFNDKLPIAVLTRATIKYKHLFPFWKQALEADHAIKDAEGLLFAKGIGEVPIRNMATFSIWESAEAISNYAYKSNAHQKSIKMTRQLDWYLEESFTRFCVKAQYGDLQAFK